MIRGSTIAALDDDGLRALARDFDALARTLRLHLAERAARAEAAAADRARIEDRRGRLGGALDLAEALAARGMPEARALARAAGTGGLDAFSLEVLWKQRRRAAAARARAIRDAGILAMARDGMSNADIRRALDPPLHPNTISRILRARVRAAQADWVEAERTRALARAIADAEGRGAPPTSRDTSRDARRRYQAE